MDNANNTGELSRRRKTSAKSKDMSESLEAFFKNTDNIKEYWKTFGGNMEKVPPTFSELKKKKNFKE
ncbi:MAG: hypothetical protein LBH96_01900 [Candidatus Peribacteria bacterium]|jgi:tRNA U55 pseudouridine synthase TruB|nr:hypothetical protein [Candidatus Peribacteria bacterium]